MMLTFEGTALDRGIQHGEALAAAINLRVDTSLARIADSTKRDQIAGPWRAQLEAKAPDLLSEMEGIAEGAAVTLNDVVLLNSFEAFDLADQIEAGGCTTVVIAGEHGAIVGQNWDANEALAKDLSVQLHRDPSRGALVVLASPGSLGWIGLNDRGLALCNNDLLTRVTRIGLPSLAVRRAILSMPDVRSALQFLRATPAVAGRSYTLGDAHGAVSVVEVAAEAAEPAVHTIAPMSHTNHAVMPSIVGHEDGAARQARYPSSPARLARAEALIDDARTAADVLQILKDHDGLPYSICRHDAPDEPTSTAASVVFDCANAYAEFRLGHPCTADRAIKVSL